MYMHLRVLVLLFWKILLVIMLWFKYLQDISIWNWWILLNFCSVSNFLGIYSLISREMLLSWTIKNTIFWKTMIKSFRWIEINYFNIFRFLAVSTNLQKMHYFGQFKDHNLPHFFIHFLSSYCLWYSFLYLKIAKVDFHGFLPLSILVCKIPEFWKC